MGCDDRAIPEIQITLNLASSYKPTETCRMNGELKTKFRLGPTVNSI